MSYLAEEVAVAPVRDAELWALLDLSKVCGEGELRRFLERVVEGSASWFRASGASLFLRESSDGPCALVAKSGCDSTVPDDAVIEPGRGISGKCLESGEPMLLGELRANERFSPVERGSRSEIGSSMVVPLESPGAGRIGVLNLSRRKGETPFGLDDLARAKLVAGYLALAVANARLVHRLDESIQESDRLRNRLEEVVRSAPVGIVVVDALGRLETANPDAMAHMGMRSARGRPLAALLSKRGSPLNRSLKVALEAAIEGRCSSVAVRDEEARTSFVVLGSPLAGGGAVLAMQDVSLHARADEEMARIRRLAEIGQMAAAIAHEIRNPLTGIQGAAQVIRDDPGLALEFARIIEEEVRKLDSLCDDFLDFARPLRLNRKPCGLREVLEPLCARMRPAFEKAGTRLLFEIEGQGPIISIDPLRVEQVAANLLLNAQQACGPGGTVRLEVFDRGFRVRDDGEGMDERAIRMLFTPFFTTKAKGSGLGLSNVRKVLDAHNAKISVQSKPQRGSVFTITFSEEDS